MAFRPNMTCFTQGIRPTAPLSWRAAHGMVADLWQAEAEAGGSGRYLSPDPRVVVFLDEGAEAVELHPGPDPGPGAAPGAVARVLYVPAGMPLRSRIGRGCRLSHLDLHFDIRALQGRLGEAVGQADLAQPLFLTDQPRVIGLARMIAEETTAPSRHPQMFDALVQALLIDLFALPAEVAETAQGGLTPHQMRQLAGFMAARLHLRVSVADLAEVIGLSESWFAHAFKKTAGTTPHRWQMELRMQRVRQMLVEPAETLANVAAATGFADQAHLSRAFRNASGTTPSDWRRRALQGNLASDDRK